ncbi:MAG: chromosome segregation protein SMC, partial [Syntrophaceae bacterium]|nr:chromosome segregation protein SMC [Syntrophaceae bacterium]
KALRGKSMDDVIFNGSAEAQPVGFAEVSMLLDAADQPFPGVYADLSELMISRKIFRDGESEYAMNGAVCRLLDIKEFFMGTGVGTRTYSIIEQNSVFNLVEAKPEDRRQFIEEAAGISKYKSRKESALRKMETTEQNLLRIQDIIREVKGQLNAVSRQAKRAEQYKVLKKGIKEAEIQLTLQSDAILAQTYEEKMQAREVLERQEESVRTALAGVQSRLEETRLGISELTDLLSKAQEEYYQVKNAVNVKEQGVRFFRGKVDDLQKRKEKNQTDLENLTLRIQEACSDMALLQDQLTEGERRLTEVERHLQRQQVQTDEAKTKNRSLQETLDVKKRQYYETITEINKLKNLIVTAGRVFEDIQRREAREKRELEEQQKRLSDIAKSLERLTGEAEADEEKQEALNTRKSRAIDELERNKEELRESGETIAALTEEVSRKSTRLASLQEFQKGYSWCNQAVKTIMTAKTEQKEDGLHHDHFIGLIADHISVPREYETAVEAVLGDKLQYVVVKSQEDGVKAIDYLKTAGLGRGSFVPMELRHHGNGRYEADHLRHAVRLIDKVEVEDQFRSIAEFLFGDVLMIPDLFNGIQLWQKNGFKGTFVTPEGDIIHPQGVLTGGKGEREEELSLLRNKREMTELEKELATLSLQLNEEKEMKKQLQRAIVEWEEDLENLRSEIQRTVIRIQGRNKDMERFQADRDLIGQRLKALRFNMEQCTAERSRGEMELAEARQALESQEKTEVLIKEEMNALQNCWDDAKKELEVSEEALTKQRIDLASIREKQDGDNRTLTRLKRDQEMLAAEIEIKKGDVSGAAEQLEDTQNRILEEESTVKALYLEQEKLEKALNVRQEALREREAFLRSQEAEADGVKKQLVEVEKKIREADLELQEIHLNREHLQKNIEEKYQIVLDDYREAFQPLNDIDLSALTAKLKKDRDTVDAFGEVNLLALTEYEEIKERYEFLTRQSADLTASLTSLQQTISRINQISRQRFQETFNAVNDCFRLVFSQIFPGGRGNLSLTDEKDLLETGVDIDIQIPGKKTQSISLLSGGEKTLAAIALIFALLLYRPTPFLILDEVDAALDDANVNLFNRLIKDVALRSQVMMVTHNKRTMEVADSLFGVTMQKQGISNLISVNLN